MAEKDKIMKRKPFKLKYKNSAFPFKSPVKHDANYEHPESMHEDYSPEEMDRIKKEDPKATFSPFHPQHQYATHLNISHIFQLHGT